MCQGYFNKYEARRGGEKGCKDPLAFLEMILLLRNTSI